MAEKTFTLNIITPDRVFYEGEVSMVEMNTSEGEIGILPGHIPMTVIVKPGILKIYEEEGVKSAALHAGFVEILPGKVTVLAEIVEWPSEIDESRALAALERAKERIKEHDGATDLAKAETALLRAIARIQVIK